MDIESLIINLSWNDRNMCNSCF